MDDLKEVQGVNGLYKVEKVKQLWYLGYGERIAYIINLDTKVVRYKEIE